MKDISYENVILSTGKLGCKYAVYGYTAYKHDSCLLAIYNSEEKVEQVLNMLHETYLNFNKDCSIFQFPDNKDVNIE